MLAGTACSGDKGSGETTIVLTIPTTSTTTLPPAQLKVALAKFFAGEGAKLLEVERVTAPILKGATPRYEACRRYIVALGRIAHPNEIFKIVARLPDPPLSNAFKDDIAAKKLLLEACDTQKPLPANALERIRPYEVTLRNLLAKHGYKI